MYDRCIDYLCSTWDIAVRKMYWLYTLRVKSSRQGAFLATCTPLPYIPRICSLLFLSWFFIRILLLDNRLFTNNYLIYPRNRYYKYYWWIRPLLYIIQMLSFHNLNYFSLFRSDWYYKNLVFEYLIVKENVQVEVHDNVTW